MITRFKVLIDGKYNEVLCYDPIDEKNENISDVGQIHHIHILDRSGSMQGSINQLIGNVQQSFEIIGEDDYLSIIWFSSPNQYKTLVKGARKTDDIRGLLNSIRFVLGTTCFSHPLKEAKTIIDDLHTICANFSVTLFTDGNPVVPWSVAEEKTKCHELVNQICKNAIAFNTVGYGFYYDQDFLKMLSSVSEHGIFTHASSIDEYFKIFEENLEKVSKMENRRCSIESKDSLILYVGPKTISGSFGFLKQRQRSKFTNHYYIMNPMNPTYNDQQIGQPSQAATPEQVEEFLYAYAYFQYYLGARKLSLAGLKTTGDKFLIDSHLKSFTYDECSEHLEKLKNAVFNPTNRYANGKVDSDYVPSDNAFCLMDLFGIMGKHDCFYVPFSDKVDKYQRIGRKAEDTFDVFEKDPDKPAVANMNDLVYSSENLNISVRFEIPGFVKINPKQAKQAKMNEKFPSKMFRTHTIVKDGNLNVKKAEFLMSEACLSEILDKLALSVYDDQKLFDSTYKNVVIDLSQIPITNLAYAKSANLKNIFKDMVQILALEARQKVAKYHLEQIMETGKAALLKEDVFKNYSIDQIRILQEHGVDKKGWYSGVSKKSKPTEECDTYTSRILEFKIKGIQKVPDVRAVYKKINQQEEMTPGQEIVADEIQNLQVDANLANVELFKPVVATRNFLNDYLKQAKQKLNGLRSKLNAMKIGLVLTGSWFDDIKTNDKGEQFYEQHDLVMLVKTGHVIKYVD
jgi:hypothetical protein